MLAHNKFYNEIIKCLWHTDFNHSDDLAGHKIYIYIAQAHLKQSERMKEIRLNHMRVWLKMPFKM